MISVHRRRGLADGEQRVACRPVRTKSVSTARCVPCAPEGAVSAHWRGDTGPTVCQGRGNRSNEIARTWQGATEWTSWDFSQWRADTPFHTNQSEKCYRMVSPVPKKKTMLSGDLFPVPIKRNDSFCLRMVVFWHKPNTLKVKSNRP